MRLSKAIFIQLAITMVFCLCVALKFNLATATEVEKDQENVSRFMITTQAPAPVTTASDLEEPATEQTVVQAAAIAELIGVEAEDAERVMLDISALQESNGDSVGWIWQPGTDINYPVVQGSDNKYYLNHSFDKEESKEGAIYIDYRCDLDGCNLVIYGHNTSSGKFDSLLNYWDSEEYLQKYSYFVYFDEENPGGIIYDVFSVIKADVSTSASTKKVYKAATQDEYEEYLNYLKDNSKYETGIEVSDAQHMILLSTCCYNSNKRLVVCGIERCPLA